MSIPTTPTSSNCLCHTEGGEGPLTDFTSKSWNTFKDAAQQRMDHIYTSLLGK